MPSKTTLLAALALALAAAACSQSNAPLPRGIFAMDTQADFVPSAQFTDQHGQPVNFASLKGKWLLVDFIYTQCPGPCELMTSRLVEATNHLASQLGKTVNVVSISLDPAHDTPPTLLAWAQTQHADRPGWLFLTGSLPNLATVMNAFHVQRHVDTNGMIDHVIEVFLVDPRGHEKRLYSPNEAAPTAVAHDLLALASE